MEASILDLRKNMKKVMSALERNERVTLTRRRRKMAVTTVRNLCYPGTPYEFWERVRRARAYMNRPDVVALFDEINPKDFPAQLGVKLALMKRRMAFAMCFLFTYVFDRV